MTLFDFALAGALFVACCWMLAARQWMRLAFAFFAFLFLAAVIYISAGAPWVGLTHLVLYVGGVLILQLFGMMLTQRSLSLQPVHRWGAAPSVMLGLGLAIGAYFALKDVPALQGAEAGRSASLAEAGRLWMTEWLAGFELLSLLLLLALVGAAALARNQETETEEPAR